MSSSINIMLVDDHAVVRAGIRRLLEQQQEFTVVAEAESGEDAYQIFGQYLPDITIIDLAMPGMGGLEAIKRILARYPSAKLLVLSMHDQAAFATQALKVGARGYLTKNSLAEELIGALQALARGETYINDELMQKMGKPHVRPMELLSVREFEIFRLLVEGVDNETIAERLKISGKTVANHQTSIKQKLAANNPIDLVRIAIRYGIISSEHPGNEYPS